MQRRFGCRPGDRKTPIAHLERATGKTRISNPRNEATRRYLYRAELDDGTLDDRVEDLFAAIETTASAAIERLVAAPRRCPSPEDLVQLAKFVVTLLYRTPDALADLAAADIELNKLTAEVMFSDAEFVRRGLAPDATDADVEAWQRRLTEDLRSGALEFSSNRTRQLAMLLGALGPAVEWLIGQAHWTVLRADPGSEFTLSDAPVAQFDPTPKFREAGAGFASSPEATTVVPIDPSVALMFRPSSDGLFDWRSLAVDPEVVADINALIYAQADESIYGSSAQRLEAVREAAIADPDKQARYQRRRTRIWVSRVDGNEDSDVGGVRTFASTNRDGTVEKVLRVAPDGKRRDIRRLTRWAARVLRRAIDAARRHL